jgi:hypothetical protein
LSEAGGHVVRRLATGVVLVVAALVMAGVAASMLGTSLADSDRPEASAQPASTLSVDDGQPQTGDVSVLKGNAQSADEDDEDDGDVDVSTTRPYVGLVVETLSESGADERGMDGGVLVRRVVEGGPSDGLIEEDDVITAVNGGEVMTAMELVELVQASEPETALTFTVSRDGESIDVDVTVGEQEIRVIKRNFGYMNPMMPEQLEELMEGGFDSFVRAEVVVEAEDGTFKTIRAVTGTVEEGSVNVDEGTFTLVPRDGPESMDYEISEDTRVMIGHTGGIEGLNSEDRTLVVDVIDEDGETEVLLVVQGELLDMLDRFRGFGGPGAGLHHFEKRMAPGVIPFHDFEFNGGPAFRFITPPEGLERLERDGLELDLDELFDNLPFDMDQFDIPKVPEVEEPDLNTNA